MILNVLSEALTIYLLTSFEVIKKMNIGAIDATLFFEFV
jgi:hypothetical protein